MEKLVDCLVGLQWGSEGKGKIAAYMAKEYKAMIRTGGPQAGHTFYNKGKKYVNKQVPCGVFSECTLYIPSSGLINPNVLKKEIKTYSLKPDRLKIDKHATVVTEKHVKLEQESMLKEMIASTLQGVGAAQSDKIWRTAVLFGEYASEDAALSTFLDDTIASINKHIKKKDAILVEGTQGFGLSLNHGAYPYVTSRDTTASALLSDSGIPPNYHNQTIGVMRTYPIRVGGNSGPTNSDEISWEEITRRSGSKKTLREFTSVTKRLRRVFEQDYETLEKAVMVNHPDQIALMFIDYINYRDHGKTAFDDLSQESKDYVNNLEDRLQVPITLIGTGQKEQHIIDRRKGGQKQCTTKIRRIISL